VTQYCACGRALHYSDPVLQRCIQDFCDRLGEDANVEVNGRGFRVQRHFIALHGIKGPELLRYGVEGVYQRAGRRHHFARQT
jgi:hypothetical protein